MKTSDWYTEISKTVEEQKKNISESDQNFYHLDRYLKAAEVSDKFSSSCRECANNKTIIKKISGGITQFINTPGRDRRNFDRNFENILSHLKKTHGLYPERYFISLYSFLGILIGGPTGFLLLMIISGELEMIGLLIGFTAGVIAGRILGNNKDKKLKAQGRRL